MQVHALIIISVSLKFGGKVGKGGVRTVFAGEGQLVKGGFGFIDLLLRRLVRLVVLEVLLVPHHSAAAGTWA